MKNALFCLLFILLMPFVGLSQNKRDKSDNEVVVSGLDNAQEICRAIAAGYEIPVINYEPVTPPKFWKHGVLTEMGFSQVSLTNWAAGGSGSIALNAYVNAYNNYEKGNMYWENRGQAAYGFIQSFEEGYKKSADNVILDSKFGYKAVHNIYFSAIFNFKSQFTRGYNYSTEEPTIVSKFLAPGYLTFGLGLDYKAKNNVYSINFAPLTTSWVIVTDTLLRTKYGNAIDEPIRFELGSQLKVNFKKDFAQKFNVQTTLTLFSDYLNKPQNIQVNWEFQTTYQVTKFLKASLRTNLLYNDNIKIANKDGVEAARVQFSEVFGLNFSYTFGEFKK